MTRRAPQQHGNLKPTASAADAADSDFPPLPKPPFKVARSSEWDDRPAVALADSGSGSASKSPATRAQLDQLFDTLSSKHNIRTAQCWSFSKYREFATPIYDHTSEAIGCCYFTVSAFIDHVICHMMVARPLTCCLHLIVLVTWQLALGLSRQAHC